MKSGMLAAELALAVYGSLLKLSAEYAVVQPILTFLFGDLFLRLFAGTVKWFLSHSSMGACASHQ